MSATLCAASACSLERCSRDHLVSDVENQGNTARQQLSFCRVELVSSGNTAFAHIPLQLLNPFLEVSFCAFSNLNHGPAFKKLATSNPNISSEVGGQEKIVILDHCNLLPTKVTVEVTEFEKYVEIRNPLFLFSDRGL